MKKILVSGGVGFLGSHLCENLLQEGNEVICLDKFYTGRKSNIIHFMLNLAEIIIDLTNSNSEIQFLDLPKYEPVRRKPDISIAKSIINWEPKVSLIEGLHQTIDYFKKELGNV